MKTYTVIVSGCNWYTVTACSFEAVWNSEKVWFNKSEMVVMDNETHETMYFNREA